MRHRHKDEDFQRFSIRYGLSPKVVWSRLQKLLDKQSWAHRGGKSLVNELLGAKEDGMQFASQGIRNSME